MKIVELRYAVAMSGSYWRARPSQALVAVETAETTTDGHDVLVTREARG
jgi:hypothetical protein